MGKRKVFTKTDLSVPQVEHSIDTAGNVVVLPEAIPPASTIIKFGRNTSSTRNFDFSRWYATGIDSITFACQRQIERFLAGQDGGVVVRTVVGYCVVGMRYFLEYCALRAAALSRNLALVDVTRDLIDGYLGYLTLRSRTTTFQKSVYTQTKPVLLALGRRGLLPLVISGDGATFPRNPFPKNNSKAKSETALSKRERQAFAMALRQAIRPLWTDNIAVTSELLAFALLVVALHTGRNTTPLVEMGRDCLRPHPKDNTVFLVLWKRRGYNTSKVALQAESDTERLLESTPSVRTNVMGLIRRVMLLTEQLDSEAPADLKGRVWLYRSRSGGTV